MSWAAVTARGTLARWVLVGSSVLLALLAGAGVMLRVTVADLADAQDRQVQDVEDSRQHALDLLTLLTDQETGLRGYVIARQPEFLEPYREGYRRTPAQLDRLRDDLRTLGLPTTDVDEVDTAYRNWLVYAGDLIALVDQGDATAATERVTSGEGKRRFDRIRAGVDDLLTTLGAQARAAQQHTRDLERRLVRLLVLAGIALGAVIVGGTVVLVAAVAWPVARLADATRAVARGHLAAPLQVTGAGEIRSLAGDVGAMRDRLTVDLDVAKRALEAAKQDSPAVAALREALAPRLAAAPGLAVAGRLDAAEGVLAGDWYDVIDADPHRTSIVLGDVSGHGPGSAVLALRFRYAVAAALGAGATPGEALAVVSRDLHRIPDDMFATVLVITIDARADSLVYANAGHPSGLLLGRATGISPDDAPPGAAADGTDGTADGDRPAERWTRLTETAALRWIDLPVTGPLLSPVVRGWAWGEREVAFGPGDTMLAFTDGILEARDPAGEQFGLARVLAVVGEHGVDDGRRLIEAIAAEVVRHTNFRSRQDDQTIVYARREPDTAQDAVPEVVAPGVRGDA